MLIMTFIDLVAPEGAVLWYLRAMPIKQTCRIFPAKCNAGWECPVLWYLREMPNTQTYRIFPVKCNAGWELIIELFILYRLLTGFCRLCPLGGCFRRSPAVRGCTSPPSCTGLSFCRG